MAPVKVAQTQSGASRTAAVRVLNTFTQQPRRSRRECPLHANWAGHSRMHGRITQTGKGPPACHRTSTRATTDRVGPPFKIFGLSPGGRHPPMRWSRRRVARLAAHSYDSDASKKTRVNSPSSGARHVSLKIYS